jgi:hypothetical protein
MVVLTARVCLLKQSRNLKEERELDGEKRYGRHSSHVTRPAVLTDLTFSPPTTDTRPPKHVDLLPQSERNGRLCLESESEVCYQC